MVSSSGKVLELLYVKIFQEHPKHFWTTLIYILVFVLGYGIM